MSSFVDRLGAELAERGVPRRRRERILDEYRDHIACEPGCETRLGEPAALARSFAAELAAAGARRVTAEGFAALTLAALSLAAGQIGIQVSVGYGAVSGASRWLWAPSVLIVLIAPQVALVAGLLGGWRAWRRRDQRELPDAEVALIRRRSATANAAGIVTCVGLLMLTADYAGRLASWWGPMQGATAALALAALVAVRLRDRGRDRIAPGVPGPDGGLIADAPLAAPVLAHPRLAVGLLGALALAGGTALGLNAERSLVEGLERGGFEAVVVVVGLTLAARVAQRRRLAA
jgi:hypothetical protein